ncbi:probable LRR receptor-like serine/threonine-protein kinase At1g63430 isoform X1 [Pyrus x bretschneideri]|uniref:probable LRR receptor-like serine/threonine-protein kinase At1g63430 isoform X1 n=1 Tax=Pyrus x bretschneideri TaxID=225117 RepID=UPI0020309AC1|nr:probable LRR receptor-like serine/threonine-protein kinase At1g63430 isoform X1 [Pyrus x bretschneideri]XP_048445528.1 probable LRR receptor-like serine/threonine-protein kinase At1g63430 isoform X1 [Pyrus x bretschneideri]
MRGFASFQLLCCLLSGVLFVGGESFGSHEVWALTTFKEAIYEDPHLVLSNWNALDADPCAWSGITCSVARDHVIKINISSSSIRGFLVPDLGQLSLLQELTLHGNRLLGIIPKELGLLKYLTVLDLGANELTGPIPPELGNLTSVVKINLQSNGLSGRLPPELGNLGHLEVLRLDRNKLQGTVPANGDTGLPSNVHGMYASTSNITGLCRSSQLKVADFSYNFFVGSIPECLEYLPRTSFQGNCLQKQDPKQRPAELCAGAPPSKGHPGSNPQHKPAKEVSKHREASKPAWLLALEIVTGTMVCSLFLVAVFTAVQKCNSKSSIIIPWKKSSSEKAHIAVYIDSEMLKDVARFSRQELEVACEDFSNIIGSSPDSLVYKGNIKGGPEIAVISFCIKEAHWTSYLELYFQREVTDLARLNHENAAKLLGYCSESAPFTRMLVFEYASNGTLYEHLHFGEGCQLSWTRRMKIIIGIAQGLKYFHSELEPPFTISELNSSAIYLTEHFLPKLVDFESWKTILARSEKNSGTISGQGAICVLPNSMEARHLDVKGNVYAFGILLLEIISGRPPFCKDKGCLIDWAKDYLELPDVMSYVVDPELKHFSYDDLKVLCDVVNLCTHPDPTKRPSMQELCTMLESKIDTSVSAELKASNLAWAELELSS